MLRFRSSVSKRLDTRLLKPYFRTEKKRVPRWPKRMHASRRNLVLILLAPDRATLRGLAHRTGMSVSGLWKVLRGKAKPSLRSARLIARALGVSTDTFVDVLEAYVWPKTEKPIE